MFGVSALGVLFLVVSGYYRRDLISPTQLSVYTVMIVLKLPEPSCAHVPNIQIFSLGVVQMCSVFVIQ